MSKIYIEKTIKETDKFKAVAVIQRYQKYTNAISRADRLSKALKARRESMVIRDSRILRKGSAAMKYAATIFYWTTDIKRASIEAMVRFAKGSHDTFMDKLYRVFKEKCKGCERPLYLNSRTELTSKYSWDQCKICRDEEMAQRDAKYREQNEAHFRDQKALRTMPYKEYLQTDHWQILRKTMLKRAGYKCSLCGESKPLHVHHNTYERRGCERISDLVVLCHECHEAFHEVKHEA